MAPQTHEAAVRDRYSKGADACEQALCCPISYDPAHLAVLPDEIIERDYGCGDPTPYVQPGDVVLDLGSGAGKVCWIAAQIAGPEGRVIGVDMTPDMLALAREHHAAIAERVGFDNVEHRRGMIQDLRLDLELLERELERTPIRDAQSWLQLRDVEEELRNTHPMIESGSIDVILSNCVLNLVRPQDKRQLFDEMYRVLGDGGRVAIADIVCATRRKRLLRPPQSMGTQRLPVSTFERRRPLCSSLASFLGVIFKTCSSSPRSSKSNTVSAANGVGRFGASSSRATRFGAGADSVGLRSPQTSSSDTSMVIPSRS